MWYILANHWLYHLAKPLEIHNCLIDMMTWDDHHSSWLWFSETERSIEESTHFGQDFPQTLEVPNKLKMTWWALEKKKSTQFSSMKLWDNVHSAFFSQCHMSNYRWVMKQLNVTKKWKASTALMPLSTHPVIPQTSPHLPPSSQVAGTPVFQLQILPLAAVDVDAQREVTINRKERQGGWALMISHEHLGRRKGTGWDGGRGSYKYVTGTCNSCFFSKTPFHLFKPNSLRVTLFAFINCRATKAFPRREECAQGDNSSGFRSETIGNESSMIFTVPKVSSELGYTVLSFEHHQSWWLWLCC